MTLLFFHVGNPAKDAGYYQQMAANIASFGVHGVGDDPTAYRVPLYPAFRALLYPLPGDWSANTVIAQSLLTLAVAILAWHLLKDRPLSKLWPLLIAASPFQALFDCLLLAESIATNLIVAGTVVLLARTGWKAAAVSGTLFGLAILTKETFLFLPLFMLPVLWWARRKHGLILLLASVLVVAPWSVRNLSAGYGPALSRGAMGINLWVGTWERDMGWSISGELPEYAFAPGDDREAIRRALELRRTGPEHDDYLKRIAIERIRSAPLETVSVWLARLPRTWIGSRSDTNESRFERGSIPWLAIKSALALLNAALLLAAIIGAFLALRRNRGAAILAIVPVYLALIYMPFHSVEDRYSSPATPFLWYFALTALLQVSHNIGRSGSIRRRSAGLSHSAQRSSDLPS